MRTHNVNHNVDVKRLIQDFKATNEQLFQSMVKKENIKTPSKGRVVRYQASSNENYRVSYIFLSIDI